MLGVWERVYQQWRNQSVLAKSGGRPENEAWSVVASPGVHDTTRRIVHSQEHRFPAHSSKLCQKWLRPEGAFYISDVQERGQHPPKGLSPFLTGRMFVRRTYFGQFDEL